MVILTTVTFVKLEIRGFPFVFGISWGRIHILGVNIKYLAQPFSRVFWKIQTYF